MYILKTKYKENVVIKDIGISIDWDDIDGVKISEETFHSSSDIKLVLDKLIIDIDNVEDIKNNIVENENELFEIKNPSNNMIYYIRNYNNTNKPVCTIYINNSWKLIESPNNSLPILANSVVIDPMHQFVTEDEKKKINEDINYNDLKNKPILSTVAKTGDYNDLKNKPIVPSLPTLSILATSGDYNDLINLPVIPYKTSDLILDSVYSKNEVDLKIKNIVTPNNINLTTTDILEGKNLYYTDNRVANSPIILIIKSEIDKITNNYMLKSIYDKNNDGIVDHSDLANNVDWSGVINKPLIPTKTSDLILDNVYSKDEVNIAIQNIILTPNNELLKSLYDKNNNGIIDRAEIADNVDWSGIINKPLIPTKTSDLILDNVYSKDELNNKMNSIIDDSNSSSKSTYSSKNIDTLFNNLSDVKGITRYVIPDGIVTATGLGVTITKNLNNVIINCPDDVIIISVTIHFNSTDINVSNCSINFGTNAKCYGTGINSDYSNMLPPIYEVIVDTLNGRTYKQVAGNLNTNSHTLVLSGLIPGLGIWVRLMF